MTFVHPVRLSDVSAERGPMADEDQLDQLHHDILEKMKEGRVTPTYLAEHFGESRQLISSRLRDLVMADRVQKVHKGLYELTDEQ